MPGRLQAGTGTCKEDGNGAVSVPGQQGRPVPLDGLHGEDPVRQSSCLSTSLCTGRRWQLRAAQEELQLRVILLQAAQVEMKACQPGWVPARLPPVSVCPRSPAPCREVFAGHSHPAGVQGPGEAGGVGMAASIGAVQLHGRHALLKAWCLPDLCARVHSACRRQPEAGGALPEEQPLPPAGLPASHTNRATPA